MINHWCAIKYKPSNKSIDWIGPSLVTIRGATIYWGGGPSYMRVDGKWDDIVKIVKDYGKIDDMDDDAIDELHDQFDLDFPPVAETKVSAGWLAPTGKFYPCRFQEHLSYAQHLAFVHYQERGDGEQRLEKEGWAKIYSDGNCLLLGSFKMDDELNLAYPNIKYTQAQLNTLGDLFVLATQEGARDYARRIKGDLDEAA